MAANAISSDVGRRGNSVKVNKQHRPVPPPPPSSSHCPTLPVAPNFALLQKNKEAAKWHAAYEECAGFWTPDYQTANVAIYEAQKCHTSCDTCRLADRWKSGIRGKRKCRNCNRNRCCLRAPWADSNLAHGRTRHGPVKDCIRAKRFAGKNNIWICRKIYEMMGRLQRHSCRHLATIISMLIIRIPIIIMNINCDINSSRRQSELS